MSDLSTHIRPVDCGVVLGGMVHAAVHAACGVGHGGSVGVCSGGYRVASSPSYHIIVHSSFSVPMA